MMRFTRWLEWSSFSSLNVVNNVFKLLTKIQMIEKKAVG